MTSVKTNYVGINSIFMTNQIICNIYVMFTVDTNQIYFIPTQEGTNKNIIPCDVRPITKQVKNEMQIACSIL